MTPKIKTQKKIKHIVHDVYLLDCSYESSINGVFEAAIAGVNRDMYISNLFFLEFNVKSIYSAMTLSSLLNTKKDDSIVMSEDKLLRKFNPYCDQKSTRFYKSILDVVSWFNENKELNEHVLLKIFTSGIDDKNICTTKIKDAIQTVIDEYNFTITFCGTPSDVYTVINDLGICATNTWIHDNTRLGVKEAFEVTTAASIEYRKRLLTGEDVSKNFYSESFYDS